MGKAKLRIRVKRIVSELTNEYDQVEDNHIDMIVDLLLKQYDDLLFSDELIQDEVIQFFRN